MYQPEEVYDDERLYNLPGYLMGQFFGYPQQPPGQTGWTFPGSGVGQPGGQFPGAFPGWQPPGQFPSGGQFPGQGQFPSQPTQPGAPPRQGQAPTSPPPAFQPQQQPQSQFQTMAVDPGAIRRCLYRFTYVWLDRGEAFWFYPTYVGRYSISGFRWQRNRWVYYGIDLNRIESFQCY